MIEFLLYSGTVAGLCYVAAILICVVGVPYAAVVGFKRGWDSYRAGRQ